MPLELTRDDLQRLNNNVDLAVQSDLLEGDRSQNERMIKLLAVIARCLISMVASQAQK